MKELSRLLGYIYENPYIGNNGFHALSAKELSFALKNMNQFERPDLFAVTDNRIIILEHFEFDASKRSRKGLIGKREEHQLEKRRISAKTNSILSLDKATYSISLYSWANNFTHYFDRHYSKIPDYIDAVRSQVNDAIHRNIIVGFFIENQFPPYVLIDGKLSMLNFINTKQFLLDINFSLILYIILLIMVII